MTFYKQYLLKHFFEIVIKKKMCVIWLVLVKCFYDIFEYFNLTSGKKKTIEQNAWQTFFRNF